MKANTCVIEDAKPAFIAGPHAPIQGNDDATSDSNDFPAVDEDHRSDDSLESNQLGLNENILPAESALDDPNVQDVIKFPVAFTNSAHHEVKLLKLLHDVGAPNYAFQSFMNWGRNCIRDEYKFQPCPQRYESQIRNLTQLVGIWKVVVQRKCPSVLNLTA